MFPGIEIPQQPEPKNKDIKESLGKLEREIFTKEGLKNFFGAIVGILNILGRPEKKDKAKDALTSEALTELQEQVGQQAPEAQGQLTQLAQEINPQSFDQTKTESSGFEKGSDGWTLCSGTAFKNLNKLVSGLKPVSAKGVVDALTKNTPPSQISDLNIRRVIEARLKGENPVDLGFVPQGNADEIEFYFQRTSRLMGKNYITGANYQEMTSELTSNGFSVCDIVVAGSTKYDHRCVGFLGHDKKWYILDPYFSSDHSTKPIPFEKYNNRIVIVVGMRAAPGTIPLVA
jgi:hypothetical protein